MKNILKSLTVATIMAMAFAGCDRESMNFDEVKPDPALPSEDDKTGFFSFSGGELVVEWNGENVNTPAEGNFTRATVMPDTDAFIVELIRTSPSPETVKTGKFGALKSSAPVELPITIDGEQCYYKVIAHSEQTMANVAYDGTVGQPTYRGETQVPIMIGNDNTTPSTAKVLQEEITCRLESIKVSVSLEKELAELCSKAEFDVKIFDPSQGVSSSPYMLNFDEYSHKYGVANLREDRTFSGFMAGYEPTCGYLKPVVSGGNGLTLHMSMNYKDITISQDLEITKNANPNEYRNIVLYLVSEDETTGSIIIGVEVHTWVYDEEVVVDVTEQGFFRNGEPKLPDPGDLPENPADPTDPVDPKPGVDGPTITWDGKDFNTEYVIGPEGMDVKILMIVPEGIKSLMVHMTGSIAEALGSDMPTDFDLVDPEKYQDGLSESLKELNFPVGDEVKGRTELLFDISEFMPMLYFTTEGPSAFELTVIDNNGASATATIKLNVVK